MRIDARQFETLAANPRAADPAAVAREFEALLVAQVWKKAVAQPLGKPTLLSGGSAGRMYTEMLIEEAAIRAARGGRFGLGAEIAERIQSRTQRAEESVDDA